MLAKAKLSNIVQRQFPEHIRENYPLLVEFVKLYYEFLQQSQNQELEKIRDIDTSLDEFIDNFKAELAKHVPLDNVSDKRLLLKNIREFYLSRGSEQSYKFLFKTLFAKEAELFYPSTQVLRVSDGKWKQDVSIFLRVTGTTQTLFPLEGKFVTITTATKTINTYVSKVVEYASDIYEVFIEREYQNNIIVDSIVSSKINNITYTGIVLPCPTKVSIFQEGTGFKVGDIFSLKTALGRGCTIKITKIGSNGGIKAIQIVSFGLDYVSTFYSYLSSEKDIAYEYIHPARLNHPTPWTPSYTDPLDHTTNYGYASKQIYFYDDVNIPIETSSYGGDRLYADGSYVGEIVGSFFDESKNELKEELAIIQIDLGAVAKYPGYYSTSDGFISDEMYIHDGEYYQAFSYVIKVEEELRKYADIVKALIHPAGMKLFAEYNITNIINVATRSILVQTVLQLPVDGADTFSVIDRGEGYTDYTTTYSQQLNDWVISPAIGASIITASQGKAALMVKKIAESIALAITSAIEKDFTKISISNQTLDDLIIKHFYKVLSETITDIAVEVIKDVTKTLTSTVANTSAIEKLIEKLVESLPVVAQDTIVKLFTKVVSSDFTATVTNIIKDVILGKSSSVTHTSEISSLEVILAKLSTLTTSELIALSVILEKSSNLTTPLDTIIKLFTKVASSDLTTPTSGISSLEAILGKSSSVTHTSAISSLEAILGKSSSVTHTSAISSLEAILGKSSSLTTPTSVISSIIAILAKQSTLTTPASSIESLFSKNTSSDNISFSDAIAMVLPVIRFGPHDFTASDSSFIVPGKEIDDSILADLNNLIKQSIINVLETVLFSDTDFVKALTKDVTDSFTNLENINKSFTLGTIANSITLSDVILLIRSIDLASSLSAPGDSNTLVSNKNLDESQTLTDSLNNAITQNTIDTVFTQGGNIYDVNGNAIILSMLKSFIKQNSESLVPIDTSTNSVSKPFSSNASSADSSTLTYGNTNSETITSSDSNTLTSIKGLTETINITMAGAILANPFSSEEYSVVSELYGGPGALLD